MELSSSNIKKCLIFSYMSGNGTPPPPPPKKKNSLYFRKRRPFIFQKTEILSSKNKKKTLFQEELPKPQNPKFIILLQKS